MNCGTGSSTPRSRLGDVATISYEQPDADFRVRAMGKPAVAVVVMKEGEANVREVSDRVAAVVRSFASNPRLRDVETLEILSQGKVIDEALATLLNSGMVGGLIAAMVLFLFMRRFRLMLILALAIPLSLLIGLTVMYFAGESLNLLTLLGLMLCVGLLVDNSVVVAENIHRLHRQGVGRRQACIRGAGEVALAITMSTVTTMVVFLPVALVAGPGQYFLLRLAIPVCVSVAASLLVALVFIPLCVYLTLEANGKHGKQGKPTIRARAHGAMTAVLRWIYEQSFGRINRAYDHLLAFFLRRRVELVLVVIFVFALSAAGEWAPFQAVKFVAVQEEERNGFFIGVDMPDNTTLEETEAWFLEAERIVESKLEELDLGGWFHVHHKTHGRIEAWFNQPRTKKITAKEATKTIVDALPEKPGMEIHVAEDRNQANDQDQSVWSLTLHGDDIDLLNEVADELQNTLVRVDGVLGMKGTDDRAANELALVIDRDRAQRYGVNPRVVAGVVGYALRGTPLPKYYKDGKEIPVRVRFREEDRESLTELAAFPIPTESGGVLPLSAVTEARMLPAPPAIIRWDKRVSSTLTLELEEGREEETRERLALLTASIDLPEGISFGANRAQDELNDDLAAMQFALFLSIVFIYLLMGFLFESFILPLSIVLTIPLSAIGVYWGHFIVGYDIDMLGVVAMVLLVGVVVNNGIVLIDYVNRLRNQGMARNEAILAATSRRFRPIMMTAITTVGGMVPLALAGANSIGLSYSSFAMTLIGGLTTATLLTLLVVPVFYSLFDDAREVAIARLRRILGRRAAVTAPLVGGERPA